MSLMMMGIGGEQVFEPNETPRKIIVPNLMPADKNYGAAIHIFTVGTCGFCRSFKKQNPEFLASDQGLVHTRITQDGDPNGEDLKPGVKIINHVLDTRQARKTADKQNFVIHGYPTIYFRAGTKDAYEHKTDRYNRMFTDIIKAYEEYTAAYKELN